MIVLIVHEIVATIGIGTKETLGREGLFSAAFALDPVPWGKGCGNTGAQRNDPWPRRRDRLGSPGRFWVLKPVFFGD